MTAERIKNTIMILEFFDVDDNMPIGKDILLKYLDERNSVERYAVCTNFDLSHNKFMGWFFRGSPRYKAVSYAILPGGE